MSKKEPETDNLDVNIEAGETGEIGRRTNTPEENSPLNIQGHSQAHIDNMAAAAEMKDAYVPEDAGPEVAESDMTKVELQDELREKDLPVSGTKAELQERLAE